VYGTGSSAVLSSCDQASARNVDDPGASASAGATGAIPVAASAADP
jgi:hypothetical protein